MRGFASLALIVALVLLSRPSFADAKDSTDEGLQKSAHCLKMIDKIADQGFPPEALAAFEASVEKAKVLGSVMGEKIFIANLTGDRNSASLYRVDLSTGEVKRYKTSLGTGGLLDVYHSGKHGSPSGLMKTDVDPHYSPYAGQAYGIQGLEQGVNTEIHAAGINFQTCGRNHDAMKAPGYRSWGSFCLKKDDFKELKADLSGSYVYSLKRHDLAKPTTGSQGANDKVCQLFRKGDSYGRTGGTGATPTPAAETKMGHQ